MPLKDRLKTWLSKPLDDKQRGLLCLGTLPLVPSERIAVLYFLAQDAGPHRAEFIAALNSLEPREIQIASQERELPGGLVDLLIQLAFQKEPRLVDSLVGHPGLRVETLRFIASREALPGSTLTACLDRQALLREDFEVAGMFFTQPNLSSTNRIQLLNDFPNLFAIPEEFQKETREAVEKRTEPSSPERSESEATTSKHRSLDSLNIGQKIVLAMKGDKGTRRQLLREPKLIIQKAVLENPKITEDEVFHLTQERSTPGELIQMIALHRDWIKNYSIKLALVKNPKCPVNTAVQLLSTLRDSDIEAISKSKSLSNMIASQAKSIMKRKSE